MAAQESEAPGLGDFFLVTNEDVGRMWKMLFTLASWGTDSPLVHTGIYVGQVFGHEEPQVIEARPGGVGFKPYRHYRDACWSTGLVPLTEAQRQEIVAHAGFYLGKKYAARTLLLVSLAQKKMGSWVSHRPLIEQPFWVRMMIDQNKVFCSAMTALCYNSVGIQLVNGYLPWLTTTGDLMRALGVISEGNISRIRRND